MRYLMSRYRWLALLVVLGITALVTGGCYGLVNYTLGLPPGGFEAGPSYPLTLTVWPGPQMRAAMALAAAEDQRAVLAIRMPVEWEVDFAKYQPQGSQTGQHRIHSSHPIADYFGATWEAAPVDATHGGPKAGYRWWAGFSDVITTEAETPTTVTIYIDTHGKSGDFQLDFVAGLTDAADPEDPAKNAGGASWEAGGTVDPPLVHLNVPTSLSPPLAPTVVASDPTPGAVDVSVKVVPTVTFSEEMDSGNMGPFMVFVRKLGGSRIPALNTYDPVTHRVTIQPLVTLSPNTDYQLVVDAAVTDAVYNPMDGPYRALFHTAGGTPSWPTVQNNSPADGATDVAVTTSVTAAFSRDMDASSISVATFTLRASPATLGLRAGGPWGAAATAEPVAATVTYDAASRTATLDPTGDLQPGTVYTAGLSTDVTADNGLPLPGMYSWSFTTKAVAGFPDVPSTHPYYNAIMDLASRRIINGYTNGNFGPGDPVTRQQFAKMIVKTLGLTVTGNEICPFVDVDAQVGTDPFYPSKYVAVCAASGITMGKTATTFAPTSNITREQLITMVSRAANLIEPPNGYVAPFTEGSFSTPEHYRNARKAAYAGLLDGIVGMGQSYAFMGSATRGEVCVLLYYLLLR